MFVWLPTATASFSCYPKPPLKPVEYSLAEAFSMNQTKLVAPQAALPKIVVLDSQTQDMDLSPIGKLGELTDYALTAPGETAER